MCNELHELNPIYVKIKTTLQNVGSFCTPHSLVQTYWQFSCKVLIWICSIHFMTWWISKDVRVTARKRRHAKFKIMNMYIWSCLKAYTMTDVALCWVTTLLEGFGWITGCSLLSNWWWYNVVICMFSIVQADWNFYVTH